MRTRAPALLTRGLSAPQRFDVTSWWRGLAPADRRGLRADVGRPPAGVVGHFVEAGSPDAREDNDGPSDYYEYLVNHEISLEDRRVFHICSAHPEARAVLTAGEIPAGFRCPRADAACPMRVLLDLAPGSNLRLALS